MIAARTKAALQDAKARGVRLGRNGAEYLAPAYKAAAVERARELAPILQELSGMSAGDIAAELTRRGVPTPRGGGWHPQTVMRSWKRLPIVNRPRVPRSNARTDIRAR